jgi:hypothetical protein
VTTTADTLAMRDLREYMGRFDLSTCYVSMVGH